MFEVAFKLIRLFGILQVVWGCFQVQIVLGCCMLYMPIKLFSALFRFFSVVVGWCLLFRLFRLYQIVLCCSMLCRLFEIVLDCLCSSGCVR